ncbi:MAG: hypothetical protein JWO73_900 [Candidatus Taylorbacteria bacterium]|nr:hypothetical protein [Candidatus Taylorbacteria bacterium]
MKQQHKEYQQSAAPSGACPLCEKPALRTFAHWKITGNKFPYDLIAKTHHMLIPIRHVTETGLNEAELKEYQQLKAAVVHPEYDYIIEATTKNKSVPAHFHLHLIVGKE